MITSKRPWTTQPSYVNDKGSFIKDASGQVIGYMSNWQDAEVITTGIEELNQTIENLEKEINKLNCQLEP